MSSFDETYMAYDLPSQTGRTSGGIRVASQDIDKPGFLTYGPYVKLSKGDYRFEIRYFNNIVNENKWDIVVDQGRAVLGSGYFENNNNGFKVGSFSISGGHIDSPLEVRSYFSGFGEVSIQSVRLVKKINHLNNFILSIVYVLLFSFLHRAFIAVGFYRACRKRRKFILFFIAVVSLVLLSVFLRGLGTYYAYKESVFPQMELSASRLQFFLKDDVFREFSRVFSPAPTKKSKLKTFSLFVEQEDIAQLNSDLPDSGKAAYVDAYLKTADEAQKVKIRYRGDNSVHWFFPKKSWRVKLGKTSLYNMEKKFNLINPPSIDSFTDLVTYGLALDMGLISPDFYPVRVFINDKYSGVHFYLSQIDESLLRRHKRMPGSIYSGDGSPLENGVPVLWENDTYWDKVSSRNKEQADNRSDIQGLLKAINDYDNLDFYKFALKNLNLDKFYKYFALDVIFGSHHHDWIHNHKLYFDPYIGKFEPIAWDVRYWYPSNHFKDLSVYPLLNRIALVPQMESSRDKVSYDYLMSNTFDPDSLMRELRGFKDLMFDDLNADFTRDRGVLDKELSHHWLARHYSLSDIDKRFKFYEKSLRARQENLIGKYNDSKVKLFMEKISKNFSIMHVSVSGNSGVEISLNDLLTGDSIEIFRDVNFNNKHDDEDLLVIDKETLYPGRKIVQGTLGKYPKGQFGDKHIEEASLLYSYLIVGEAKVNNRITSTNIVTGSNVVLEHARFDLQNTSDSLHPWKLANLKVKSEKILSGNVEIDKTLVIDENISVKILPGTTISLKSDVSLIFYGQVEALGTKENPIRFVSQVPSEHWGSVVLQGQGTSGSKFNHVDFSNGSITSYNLVNYTAQFNIHDASEFEVSNCTIGPNHVGDDSMHIAYSKGIVENSIFYGARSDALDIDIADVVVRDNVFINSGNDSLDLMTSEAKVENNIFINAGDKGISTGEWTTGDYGSNLFYNCLIGLEIKDKSEVTLTNDFIVDSGDKAINLYNKNNRYDEGGTVTAESIFVRGNDKITADKRSSINIQRVSSDRPRIDDFPFASSKLNLKKDWSNLDAEITKLVLQYQ
jgi:hypothetical protein